MKHQRRQKRKPKKKSKSKKKTRRREQAEKVKWNGDVRGGQKTYPQSSPSVFICGSLHFDKSILQKLLTQQKKVSYENFSQLNFLNEGGRKNFLSPIGKEPGGSKNEHFLHFFPLKIHLFC